MRACSDCSDGSDGDGHGSDGSDGDGEVDGYTIPATITHAVLQAGVGRQAASGKPWTPPTQPELSQVIDVDVIVCKASNLTHKSEMREITF